MKMQIIPIQMGVSDTEPTDVAWAWHAIMVKEQSAMNQLIL